MNTALVVSGLVRRRVSPPNGLRDLGEGVAGCTGDPLLNSGDVPARDVG
jgi:hypothetical protein